VIGATSVTFTLSLMFSLMFGWDDGRLQSGRAKKGKERKWKWVEREVLGLGGRVDMNEKWDKLLITIFSFIFYFNIIFNYLSL